ncbi:MAG: hypothetical protein HY913_00850 [Desulfomonile tiedjei]|nr:hypothetical protein [Desulfomonile tiedjei]
MNCAVPENEETTHPLWYVGAGLSLYCLAVTVLTGDIGFEGDDWWIFSWPFWNRFPSSLWIYARESLRPVEGVYWITLYELFGFNKPLFHLFSQLLLAGASLLMGVCLDRAFPKRRVFVVLAVLFAFFMPTVSCLTYVVTTDNSRLSLLLFWASCMGFQGWARRSESWTGLALPILIYVLAFLTYEASTLLILVVPLLVWPVHCRNPYRIADSSFAVRLGTGLASTFALVLLIRFMVLSGGAVSHSHVLPPLELLWSYVALLPFYLVAPFTSLSPERWSWALGVMVAIWAAMAVYRGRDSQSLSLSEDEAIMKRTGLYVALLGTAIVFLGMLPYQLAGYGSVSPKLVESVLVKWGFMPHGEAAWFNFNWSSRIYSSSSFGLAILLAALITVWRRKAVRLAAITLGVVAIVLLAVFHSGLSTDWKEAAEIRNKVTRSLVSQAPEVEPNSNFVFLNLESRHKRAAVFRGWMGLKALIQMLYDDRTLGAWYLYPYAWTWPNRIYQQGVVSSRGFVSRGIKLDSPAAHDSLLIFKREGEKLALLDGITHEDGLTPTGLVWKDAEALRSNSSRIVAWGEVSGDPRRMAHNSWTTGLISTLRLSRATLAAGVINKWTRGPQRGRVYGALLQESP